MADPIDGSGPNFTDPGVSGSHGPPPVEALSPTPMDSAVVASQSFSEMDYELVRACWDDVRWCRAYDLYFGEKLHRATRTNRGAEIVVAGFGTGSVGASGGAIAGWAFWQSATGAVIWAILGASAAATAWVKPFLRLDQAIEQYSKLQQEYRALFGLLRDLPFAIQQQGKVSEDHQARYAKVRERMQHASQQWPPIMDKVRIEGLQDQVADEMPADKLWMPKIPGVHPKVPKRQVIANACDSAT
jgi:hypothetical protein